MKIPTLFVTLSALVSPSVVAAQNRVEVKVFVGSMFEIGEMEGDRAGEFQAWYEDYFTQAASREVRGAANPVWCNSQGVCGSILGMGKVASSSSMMAILLDPSLDFSNAYFLLTGVAGTPPDEGTIGAVSWATWLVDYDLGHRWAADEVPEGEPLFMPRDGYEDIRVYELNADLVERAIELSSEVALVDSEAAQDYRERYPQETARRAPFIYTGTHMTGDTFFHGPGLSEQAQYMTELYGADDYVITEMESAAVAQVIDRMHGTNRLLGLRGAVNFDQGNPNETTLEHLDPAPGETAGGFAETITNIHTVGAAFVDEVVTNWDQWREEIPPK